MLDDLRRDAALDGDLDRYRRPEPPVLPPLAFVLSSCPLPQAVNASEATATSEAAAIRRPRESPSLRQW
ncbi:hypothetical protein [Streptomyces platensis]|uniref:hypothetical protein n=1 Tax=Streptomyces platensis TaxID=58346 RepID=UPI003867F073|nr:hypothetical protein OG962_01235 [Streptomyces platensis]